MRTVSRKPTAPRRSRCGSSAHLVVLCTDFTARAWVRPARLAGARYASGPAASVQHCGCGGAGGVGGRLGSAGHVALPGAELSSPGAQREHPSCHRSSQTQDMRLFNGSAWPLPPPRRHRSRHRGKSPPPCARHSLARPAGEGLGAGRKCSNKKYHPGSQKRYKTRFLVTHGYVNSQKT